LYIDIRVDDIVSMERIKSAAVRYPEGTGLRLSFGEDHSVAIDGVPKHVDAHLLEMGFVTEDNRFVTRSEAYEIAVKAGQIKEDSGERILTSEMLRHARSI